MSDKGKGIAKDDDDDEARQTKSRYGGAGNSRNLLRDGSSTWIRERRDPSTRISREQQEEARRLMPPPPPPPPRTSPIRLTPSVPRPRHPILRRIKIKFRTPGPSKSAVMSLPEAPGPVQLKGKGTGALKGMQQMQSKALLIASNFSDSSSAAPRTSAPTPSPALSPQPSSSDPPRRRYQLVKITELENIEDDNKEKGAASTGGINIRDPKPPSDEGATSAGGINIRDRQPSGEGATSAGGINIREPQPPSGQIHEARQGNVDDDPNLDDSSSCKETY